MPCRCRRLRRSPAVSTSTKVVSPRLEHRVDRVARRPRHLRDDHPLLAEQRVQERRLADVRPAEDRDADRLVADRRLSLAPGQPRDDLVEQVAGAVAVERRERHRVAEAEPVELDRIEVAARVVDLVREHDHRLARGAQDRRELLVARRDARPRVDDEEDEVGLVDRRARLRGDRGGPNGPVSASSTPPVSTSRNVLAGPVAEELLAVARDAGRLVDDGRAGLRQPVDERRLADVREADDRDRAGDPPTGSGRARSLVHAGHWLRRAASPSGPARARASRRASPRGGGSPPGRAPTPPCSPSRPSAAPRTSSARPTRSRPAGGCPASTSASRGSRPGRSARPPGARPSPLRAAPRPGRPSAGACPRRRARARAPRARSRRIVRTASRSDSPRRTGKQPKRADERAEPGNAVRLDLGHVVDRCAGSRRRAPRGRATRSGSTRRRTRRRAARDPCRRP